ncbi:MAG: glycosyltransferase [Bacteroidota bacterium]|nr:glycosyltransferase [Bacteroidota bacterium]
MKKKLIVLTNSAHMYQGAGGRTRIVHEIKEVFARELDVRLLCLVQAKNYRSIGKLKAARKKLAADTGVKVTYIPRIPTFNNWILYRIADIINAFVLLVCTRLWGCRSIQAHGISAAVPAAMLKSLDGSIRLLTDVHGAMPEEDAYGRNKNEPERFKKYSRIEKKVLERSDLVFLVSERMRTHYLEKYGLALADNLVVPCLTHDYLQTLTEIPEALKSIGNRLVFTYSGSYRAYQLVDETFFLFQRIMQRFPESFFLVLTNQVTIFEEKARGTGLTDNDFKILSLARGEVHRHLQHADIGFLLRDDSVVNKVASPTKFAEYLLAGLPVITTEYVGDYASIVNAQRIGYTVSNLTEPEEALFTFIADYAAHKQSYKQRARQYAANSLTWTAYNKAIVDTLKRYEFL